MTKTLQASLKELFEIQAGLDSEINLKHPVQEGESRLQKKHVALLVELSETMQEIRFFKFWSTDQQSRKYEPVKCFACGGTGDLDYESIQEAAEGRGGHQYVECQDCNGTGISGYEDRVLKELVDVLHFILSIGLEHKFDEEVEGLDISSVKFTHEDAALSQFTELSRADWHIYEWGSGGYYHEGLELFLGFCEILGYTWEQVVSAYMEKNQENHRRIQSGY